MVPKWHRQIRREFKDILARLGLSDWTVTMLDHRPPNCYHAVIDYDAPRKRVVCWWQSKPSRRVMVHEALHCLVADIEEQIVERLERPITALLEECEQ